MANGRVVCFVGLPGSGKSSQSKRLCDQTGGIRQSPGDWLRSRAGEGDKISRTFIADGRHMTIEVFNEWLRELDDTPSGDVLVFDGAPRSEDQAHALVRRYMTASVHRVDTIVLEVSIETARRRLRSRIDQVRTDDTSDLIEARLARHAEEMDRTIKVLGAETQLHIVDASASVETVEVAVLRALELR